MRRREREAAAAAEAAVAAEFVEPAAFTVGGRTFVPVGRGTTLNHQLWLMGHVAAAGLAEVLTSAQARTPTGAAAIANAVLWRAAESGRLLLLLAGSVVEEGQPRWDEATAIRLAAWFGELTDSEDHRILTAQLVGVLASFFTNAPLSGATSPTPSPASTPRSSAAAATPRATRPTSARPRPAASGATSATPAATSASGARSPGA